MNLSGLGQLTTADEIGMFADDQTTGGGWIMTPDMMPIIPPRPALPPRTPVTRMPGMPAHTQTVSGWLQTSSTILGVSLPNWLLAGIGVTAAIVIAKGKR